jgi:hypothetical protein
VFSSIFRVLVLWDTIEHTFFFSPPSTLTNFVYLFAHPSCLPLPWLLIGHAKCGVLIFGEYCTSVNEPMCRVLQGPAIPNEGHGRLEGRGPTHYTMDGVQYKSAVGITPWQNV